MRKNVWSVLLGMLWVGVSSSSLHDVEAPNPASINPGVEVAGVFEVPGRTEPSPGRSGLIAPTVLHPVISVLVAPGDRVKAGQVLVQLDDDEPQADVLAKKSTVAEMRAGLAKLESMPRQQERAEARAFLESAQEAGNAARISFDRAEALRKVGAISERAYHETRSVMIQRDSDILASSARLERLIKYPVSLEIAEMKSKVNTAEAELKAVEAELDHFVIPAPIDGIISWLNVKPGTVTKPGFGIWGEVLDLSEIDIRSELTPDQAEGVAIGQLARVFKGGSHPTNWDGKVIMVGIVVDARTGRVPVVIRITGVEGRLRSGAEVKVRLGYPSESAKKPTLK